MRIMAIDYGDARTGVAISDISGTLTGETLVIKEYNEERVIAKVVEVAVTRKAELLIVGYPKNMNGTIGPRAEKSQHFADILREQSGLPVELRDERLTTVDAHRILSQTGTFGKKRKNTVDAVAAALILENYLASLH